MPIYDSNLQYGEVEAGDKEDDSQGKDLLPKLQGRRRGQRLLLLGRGYPRERNAAPPFTTILHVGFGEFDEDDKEGMLAHSPF